MESLLAAIGTILGVGATMFFRDWRDGRSIFKRNGNGKQEIPAWAQELTTHFNETTTEVLKDIRDGVRDMNTKIDQIKPCQKE